MGRISREGCRFSLRPSRARPSPSRRHHRCRKGQDPGQGGNPSRPAASYLRRQAARGWPHPSGLQHPEGVDPPPCASPRRSWRTQVQSLEEVHSEDALEVEEEEDASPPTRAQEDASALQVNLNLLRSRKSCWCSKIFCCAEPSTREINCTLPGQKKKKNPPPEKKKKKKKKKKS